MSCWSVPARICLVAVAVGLTAGCGARSVDESSVAEKVTVFNCGREVSVEGPPQRVYAAYQPAAEMIHALGLSYRLVGSAFFDGEMLPEYAGGQQGVPYSEALPTRDALLATNPDFVFGGYGTVFADDTPTSVGSRQSLSELGIQSYVITPFCPSQDGRSDQAVDPANVRVDVIYEDLRNLGELFGVQDRAQRISAEMQARIAAVEDAVAGADRPTVAFVQPQADGTFQVSGAIDFGTQIIEHAGGVNAFADVTETRNIYVDAEEIVRRDPDVILTASGYSPTFTRDDAQPDVDTIVGHPAFSGLRAVRGNAVHPYLFADRSAGVRTAYQIELVASLIHPDLVK
ncbi:ABC transporter substrate-binding protein [Mycolicibacterium bacteremicum]|uniref:ABC transporter substrate-binding protein n=1 Tax=Mycolicibacterium bacteremicum TaxID=564198 RepID=UPI0026F327EC|nr:ABC transporter substrate-binding protein [Mycolicibacterium bacteremicum]